MASDGTTGKVTRRQLAAALAAPALLAQTPPPGDTTAALDQIRHNGELLAKVDVPAGVEPAVHFKV